MPEEVANLAQQFIDAGGHYTSELLHTNEVSLCAVLMLDPDNLEPHDIVATVVPNGPEVTKAVEDLIRESVNVLQQLEVQG
jgi:hypothetical protein